MVPVPSSFRLYRLYNHWMMRTATYFFIFLNLSLALFEEPAVYPLPFLVSFWCRSSKCSCWSQQGLLASKWLTEVPRDSGWRCFCDIFDPLLW